jgi:hypothetical protein
MKNDRVAEGIINHEATESARLRMMDWSALLCGWLLAVR